MSLECDIASASLGQYGEREEKGSRTEEAIRRLPREVIAMVQASVREARLPNALADGIIGELPICLTITKVSSEDETGVKDMIFRLTKDVQRHYETARTDLGEEAHEDAVVIEARKKLSYGVAMASGIA